MTNKIHPYMQDPSEEYIQHLLEVFTIDPDEGIIRRKSNGLQFGGTTAGNTGYFRFRHTWQGEHYEGSAHRIAWLLYYGEYPALDMEMDHINNIRTDNRKCNLRLVSSTQNKQNRTSESPTRVSPYKGVVRMVGNRRKPWQTRIVVDGINKHIGTYETPEEAAKAYDAAAELYFGAYAKVNFKNAPAPIDY